MHSTIVPKHIRQPHTLPFARPLSTVHPILSFLRFHIPAPATMCIKYARRGLCGHQIGQAGWTPEDPEDCRDARLANRRHAITGRLLRCSDIGEQVLVETLVLIGVVDAVHVVDVVDVVDCLRRIDIYWCRYASGNVNPAQSTSAMLRFSPLNRYSSYQAFGLCMSVNICVDRRA